MAKKTRKAIVRIKGSRLHEVTVSADKQIGDAVPVKVGKEDDEVKLFEIVAFIGDDPDPQTGKPRSKVAGVLWRIFKIILIGLFILLVGMMGFGALIFRLSH